MSIAQFFEANAGTGKTWRLTEAIATSNVPMERICAVTFTDTAATEMIDRLRQKMTELVEQGRKRQSELAKINDCFIGTIHGFCNQILKRYGEQIGLPPLFQVDAEGEAFYQELFETRWNSFITDVLKKAKEPYNRLIMMPGIEALRLLANNLATRRYRFSRPDDTDTSWLISSLRDSKIWEFNPKAKWEKLANQSLASPEENRDILLMLIESGELDPTKWKNAISDTLNCRPNEIYSAIEALQKDFVDDLLREYRMLGYVRYEDLIIDTRNILRDHREIRKQLKEKYDLILVDEMQDTDPVQYEIFLYLCEKNGSEERFTLQDLISCRKKLRLQEGKLFVVGDPKQSIYGFRKADLNAYERIKDVFSSQAIQIQPLDQNYRSCPNIVQFTNELAKELFASNPPKNSAAQRKEFCEGKQLAECVHVTEIQSENANVVHLRVLAEANWLADCIEKLKQKGEYSYKDVGILLRKLTNAHLYIDALATRRIPVVVEGEKFFYQSQEIIDFLSLLKFIVDPMDSIALAGMLRSPLFGLKDSVLVLFFQEYNKNFDLLFSLGSALEGAAPELREALSGIAERIFVIRRNLKDLTPGKFMDQVLKSFPVLTIASVAYGSYRAQLAPLNILKIHKEALAADLDPITTPYRFVKELELHSKEAKESPQEAIADEGTEAVRILSIHKSKGLDFPVVFVPLTDYAWAARRDSLEVIHDWETDEAGLRLNVYTEPKYLRLKYGSADEEIEQNPLLVNVNPEERRVLYVAATRAKKELFFCYVPNTKKKDNALGKMFYDLLSDKNLYVPKTIETAAPWFTPSQNEPRQNLPVTPVLDEWKTIDAVRERHSTPVIRSITLEAEKGARETEEFQMLRNRAGVHAALIGSICHAALEKIDYRNAGSIQKLVESVIWKFSGRFTKNAIANAAKESVQILENFCESDAFRWLSSVEILAREMPVQTFDATSSNPKILTGTIDLFLRDGEQQYILDFKTNLELDAESMKSYSTQMRLYLQALASKEAAMKAQLCMLRSCELVSL